jgi:hypothetical protein
MSDFSKQYEDSLGKEIKYQIDKVACDSKCVTLVVKPLDLPIYPVDKALHVTLMLADGCKPVYSNELIKNTVSGGFLLFDEVLEVSGQLCYE